MLQLTITDIDAMQWFKPQKQGTRLFVDSLYFGHFKEPTRRDFLAVGLAHTQWQAVFHDGELSVATAPMWCSPAPPANANGPAWTFYHVIHGHEWTDLATPPGVGDHWRNPENFRSTFITEYMLKNTMNGFRGMKEKNPVVDNIGDLHWGSDGAIFFRSMVDAVLMCTLAKPGEGPVQILQVTVPAADTKSTEDCFLGVALCSCEVASCAVCVFDRNSPSIGWKSRCRQSVIGTCTRMMAMIGPGSAAWALSWQRAVRQLCPRQA